MLAGIWSGGHVELGILPLGAFGVAVSSMLLFTAAGTVLEPGEGLSWGLAWALALLFVLGASAGLFSVPLEAYMQHRSPPRQRGSVLAAMNFLVFLGVLLAALLFAGLRHPTFPGSLDNVAEVQTRLRQLPGNERAELNALVADLPRRGRQSRRRRRQPAGSDCRPAIGARQPEPHDPTCGSSWMSGHRRHRRDVAQAQLVWVELKERQRRGEFFTKDEYLRLADSVEQQQVISDVYYQASNLPLFTARQIFLLAGLFTIPVFLYIIFLIPQASVRFLVWLASRTVYRIRVFGHAHLAGRMAAHCWWPTTCRGWTGSCCC